MRNALGLGGIDLMRLTRYDANAKGRGGALAIALTVMADHEDNQQLGKGRVRGRVGETCSGL